MHITVKNTVSLIDLGHFIFVYITFLFGHFFLSWTKEVQHPLYREHPSKYEP